MKHLPESPWKARGMLIESASGLPLFDIAPEADRGCDLILARVVTKLPDLVDLAEALAALADHRRQDDAGYQARVRLITADAVSILESIK